MKGKLAPHKTVCIVLFSLIVLCIIGMALICSTSFYLAAAVYSIMAVIFGVIGAKKPPVKTDVIIQIVIIAVFTLIHFSTPPIMVFSSLPWQYPVQSAYIGLYHNIKEPWFFPVYINKYAEKPYSFDYQPSIMQGAGHYSVTFNLSAYSGGDMLLTEEQYSKNSILAIPLKDYPDNGHEVKLSDGTEGTVLVFVDDLMKECPDAVIYVLDTNYNFNHPRTSAVIIDKNNDMIEFSQLG